MTLVKLKMTPRKVYMKQLNIILAKALTVLLKNSWTSYSAVHGILTPLKFWINMMTLEFYLMTAEGREIKP